MISIQLLIVRWKDLMETKITKLKILFISLIPIYHLNSKGIYIDLLNEIASLNNLIVYCFPGSKRRQIINSNNIQVNEFNNILKHQKTNNYFLKIVSYLLFSFQIRRFIHKTRIQFDGLLLVTPSIFQHSLVKKFKKKFNNKKVILLLKDIFPDNAIDLKMFEKIPFKNFIISYFRFLENSLYNLVDYIGCMNKSNLDYISKKHRKYRKKLFLSYNSIKSYKIIKKEIQIKVSKNKKNFVFLGNVGLPQFIEGFKRIIELSNNNVTFFLVGSGTQFKSLNDLSSRYPKKLIIINETSDHNFIDNLLIQMNAGLILLDPNFKVPNFPSKLLTYLNANLPIIAFTEKGNEISKFISRYKIGKWEYYGDINKCVELINHFSFNAKESNFSELLCLFSVKNQANDLIKLIIN